MSPPRATYRIQFSRDFGFADGAAVVPYLDRLGVSHLYASPILAANPGSPHGYDIVDHDRVNPELGGEAGLSDLVAALRRHAMGLVVDIVPNHMGVGGAKNAAWLDVLEWGRASPAAAMFDIDWTPGDPRLRNRVMAPFLGDPYGEVLRRGELRLVFDAAAGTFSVQYFEHRFPIAPARYPLVLHAAGPLPPALEAVARAMAALGGTARGGSRRGAARAAADAAKRALAVAAQGAPERAALDRALAAFDAGGGGDAVLRLHRLLEAQPYRLAWWRAASDEINYRRFFDINGLAGLRVEDAAVFERTHRLLFRLWSEGLVDGVRIDHVDGLADPGAYCRKLRRRLEALAPARPPGAAMESDGAPWIVVEKILARHERPRADWRVDGTTGYDFMDEVAALLHDPEGAAPLARLLAEAGEARSYAEVGREARRQVLRDHLASEVAAVAETIHGHLADDLATRDFTLTAVRRAVVEVIANFPVYRTYVGGAGAGAEDRRTLAWAFAGAARAVRATERPLLAVLEHVLAGAAGRALPPGPGRSAARRAVTRFQQLTGPAMAKGLEDTAHYRWPRLLSRNEVGSDPDQLSLAPAAFHRACRERARRGGGAMLATATHDHKRGEDARARLAVLSELAVDFADAAARWRRLNAGLRRDVEGAAAPSPLDEHALYQTLIGAWPMTLAPDDADGVGDLVGRVQGWLVKALREAKTRSEWAVPNEPYEAAAADFVARAFGAEGEGAGFRRDLAAFVQAIAPAGALNGLAQTLLRLTVPGVPDTYQGTERWDLSLVDPDNRRPVDWATRAAAAGDATALAGLVEDWRDGRIKQRLIEAALARRRAEPALWAEGRHLALRVVGPMAANLLAFARARGGAAALVAVPRLVARPVRDAGRPLVPAAAWGETRILLPPALQRRAWSDALDPAAAVADHGQSIRVAALLARAPVALLTLARD